MTTGSRVLLIEDEPRMAAMLTTMLSHEGYEVITANTGMRGLRAAYNSHPDAILLDVMMPDLDGFETCRRLREMCGAAIIFVTVCGKTDDVVRGLRLGADDYIIKPFHYRELSARLEACLRRKADNNRIRIRMDGGEALLLGDDTRRLVFLKDGRTVKLTPTEYRLLQCLYQNRGHVQSTEQILAQVWGSSYTDDKHLVKQFIYRLRRKLEDNPSRPKHILTIHSSGYLFEESPPSRA